MSKAKMTLAADRMAGEFLRRCEDPKVLVPVGTSYCRRLFDDPNCALNIPSRGHADDPVRLRLRYNFLATHLAGGLLLHPVWFANAGGAQVKLSEMVLSRITGTRIEYSRCGWTSDGVPVSGLTTMKPVKSPLLLLPPQPDPTKPEDTPCPA